MKASIIAATAVLAVISAGPASAQAAEASPVPPQGEAQAASELEELKARVESLEQQAGKDSASELPEWLQLIEIHAFLSTAYTWNFNDPDSRANQFRVFDFKHNEFRVDDFELSVLNPVTEPGDVGFRVDFDVGSNIPRVIHSAGLFEGEDFDLRQAFVSYNAPLGDGLTVDFGKFITHFGLEVIEGWPGFNDNYSRSFDFGFAIPFTHTGLRATYPLTDQLSAMAMVVNGWDKVDDNNNAKGVGGQIGWVPSDSVSLYFNYLGSPEQRNNDHDWRHLFGVVWIINPLPTALPGLTFSGTYDYGTESGVALAGGNADWHAVEGVFRYDFTDWFYLALRGEWMADEGGSRTGTDQDLWGFTLTPAFTVADHIVIRPEVRVDRSSEDVFEADGGNKRTQITGAVNALFYY